MVQFTRGSVPEETLASTHPQARAVCRTRCFSGFTLLLHFTFLFRFLHPQLMDGCTVARIVLFQKLLGLGLICFCVCSCWCELDLGVRGDVVWRE